MQRRSTQLKADRTPPSLVISGIGRWRRRRMYRVFPRDRALPSRLIVIDGSGSISFDVLSWLSEQNVPLIRINWRGES
jgi:hypothetical protein